MSRSLDDKLLGDEDHVPSQVSFDGKVVAEPKYQPINKATHECLRGPCEHFWKLIVRIGDANVGDQIQIGNISQCNKHCEATELKEQNIYHCNMWWPSFLSWIPLSLQSILRPRLRAIWNLWLKRIGYDFSWKNWPDDIFEHDAKELRGNSSPGAPSNVERRGKIKKSSVGIEFNT